MNCKSVRKFLYAFADGQLGVKANCEVLDHLKMCPSCSRKVDEHQHLRKALGRSLQSITTPAGLSARVEQAIYGGNPLLAVRRGGRFGWRSVVAFVGVAAALVFAASLFIFDFEPSESPPMQVTMTGASARGMAGARAVADVHARCTSLGKAHQEPSLPGNLKEVSGAVSEHFDNRLAVSFPDLSGFGYEFESANYCGLKGPGSDVGGHVVYASPKNGRISFFVTPRSDQFEPMPGTNAADDGPYRQFEIPSASGTQPLVVLAWHRGATTYVCCGDVDAGRLRHMVGAIRTAMVDFDDRLTIAFASMKSSALQLPELDTH